MKLYIFLIGLIYLLPSCQKEKQSETAPTTTKKKVSSTIKLDNIPTSKSGIQFNNTINDEGNINFFVWNFIYTGAGVAAGDLNNDGLPDLYFGGNMSDDKIYFNKGNFLFEDVTAKSGIDPRYWTTGVTMADVNADGFLDIYVCKNSPSSNPVGNQNKLFINNQNGTFTESAAQYGIADVGFSIQASFFDIDNDGDLDMYLVNQPFDDFARLVNKPEQVMSYPATDRIFIMENGKYLDKTTAFQLNQRNYGLNISIGDFDLDGWTDAYVSNDYHHPDHLYMNRKGQLVDELKDRTGHISFFSMGTDAADINNDGQLDLISLDMAFDNHYRAKTNMESMNPEKFWSYVKQGKHYQYAANNLQINQGNATFKDHAQLAGISKTDWSAAPLFIDLDADGLKDLLITNGIYKDLKNNDFSDYVTQKYKGRIGPTNYLDALSKMPSNPIKNVLYQNKGAFKFDNISTSSGFSFEGFSHGMAYADFDQDGKIDVVCNNMNAPASLYRNTSTLAGDQISIEIKGPQKNKNGLGISVIAYHNGTRQVAAMQTTRGFLSSSEPLLHFGFRPTPQIDSLKIIWNHKAMTVLKNVKTNQKLTIDFLRAKKIPLKIYPKKKINLLAKNNISFRHIEKDFDDFKDQVLLPYKLSQNGPFITSGDVDGDGLEDLFIGGAAGYAGQVFRQNGIGNFTSLPQSALEKDKACEDMEASLVDLDVDGDLDLIVSSGSNEIQEQDPSLQTRIYFNNGKGVFQKMNQLSPKNQLINGQCHLVFDADGDKDLDLFIGGRLKSGQYPLATDSKLWINQNGKWVDETKQRADFLHQLGMVTDVVSDDIDKDGDQDLLLVGEWMAPTLLINDQNKTFNIQTIEETGIGIWWTINKADFDQDGNTDFLLGNLGLNNKFGGPKGTGLEIYSHDFDNNGDHDVVLAVQKGNKKYPVRGRECSSQEMPFINQKFTTYEAFGKAELSDILSSNQLKNSLHKKTKTLASVLLMNTGELNFKSKELPIACQAGPIKSFEILDLNQDGFEDFIFGGNHYPTEVETSRYDALTLGFCLGNGKGEFEPIPHAIYSTETPSDVRDLQLMTLANGEHLLFVTNNNDQISSYQIQWNK